MESTSNKITMYSSLAVGGLVILGLFSKSAHAHNVASIIATHHSVLFLRRTLFSLWRRERYFKRLLRSPLFTYFFRSEAHSSSYTCFRIVVHNGFLCFWNLCARDRKRGESS